MRHLGIDYGKKRIGLALSDPDGRIAFPREVVNDLGGVLEFARREGVELVIIGLPLSATGEETETSRAARQFGVRLEEALQLPVEFENELFSTKLAEESSPKGNADASAAALILQSYLDRQRK